MRLLVCGGRDFVDYDLLKWYIDFIHDVVDTIEVIIHGGARGADSLAGKYAKENYWKIEVYEADWKKYGKSAGYKRNKKMLEESKPDFVLVMPGGKGTSMMLELVKEKNEIIYFDVEKMEESVKNIKNYPIIEICDLAKKYNSKLTLI